MKYIRMKDGTMVDTSLYKKVVEREFNGEVVTIDLNHWGQDNNKAIQMIKVKDITKQADTIEELCDEIVIDNPQNWRKTPFTIIVNITQYVKDLKTETKTLAKNDIKIFGAIWTDKGLIYVAKLNEKGELELI